VVQARRKCDIAVPVDSCEARTCWPASSSRFPDLHQFNMAPTWLAALAVLLLLGGAAAQPSFSFPAIPNLIAGQTSDTKDLLVTLNNPVPNPPGPTFFPVTLTATLNNNLITMNPTQVTFNAAGSWQGVFTIAASSTAPPGFSPSFLAMTNITWAVDDTVHYAPPASFNVSVVPSTPFYLAAPINLTLLL
jgi:hypothetical protein